MSLLEQIALAWQALGQTLRQLFRPVMWVPWLLLGAVQAGVVFALGWFAHPAVSWFAAPLVRWLGGREAVHYPRVFGELPALYARVDLVVGGVLGAIVIGAATALFAARFAGREARPGEALGWSFGHAFTLVVVNLPLNLLLLGFSFALDAVLTQPDASGLARRAAMVGGLAIAMLLQAAFLYVNPLVVVSGRGVGSALAALPRAAARGWWAAFFLALLAVLALLPLQRLASAAQTLVERGKPELVAWLTLAQVAAALLAAFVLTGSATLVYQGGVAREMERER